MSRDAPGASGGAPNGAALRQQALTGWGWKDWRRTDWGRMDWGLVTWPQGGASGLPPVQEARRRNVGTLAPSAERGGAPGAMRPLPLGAGARDNLKAGDNPGAGFHRKAGDNRKAGGLRSLEDWT